MSFKEIKELIDLVSERGLAGLEVERSGFRLRIEGIAPAVTAAPPAIVVGAPALTAPATEAAPASASAPAEDVNVHVITSPIVGTFYRSPSPESDPFAEIGQRVSPGKVLCIIESMKLMNEIESDVAGEILEVFPSNGAPVEYGERLFAIRTAA
ncbi:MAG TPA: acetyl-CoA carboxylase biotin carboxyl carrier protein [Thermoanaerobaculia bacterium]